MSTYVFDKIEYGGNIYQVSGGGGSATALTTTEINNAVDAAFNVAYTLTITGDGSEAYLTFSPGAGSVNAGTIITVASECPYDVEFVFSVTVSGDQYVTSYNSASFTMPSANLEVYCQGIY